MLKGRLRVKYDWSKVNLRLVVEDSVWIDFNLILEEFTITWLGNWFRKVYLWFKKNLLVSKALNTGNKVGFAESWLNIEDVFSVSEPNNLFDIQILVSIKLLESKGFCIKDFASVIRLESLTKFWLLQKLRVNQRCCFAMLFSP